MYFVKKFVFYDRLLIFIVIIVKQNYGRRSSGSEGKRKKGKEDKRGKFMKGEVGEMKGRKI